MGMMSRKPRIGVFKFASCDGCQLTVLDCEDELLDLAERVDIAYFLEAIRRPLEGEFDIALVEGSIYTPEQEAYIRDIRQRSRFLITLGACAAHGGIQALRNFTQPDDYPRMVYALPQYVESLAKSQPAGDYVRVDLELQGCPISKQQLLRLLAQLLLGSKPHVPNHALCLDCKRQNIVCVLVAQGKPCMGPVTTTGCGVLCPSHDRACYSCFGPDYQPNTESLARWFSRLGFAAQELHRMFHAYYSQAREFKEEGERHA
jgi:coenzyme F420-reducing hydrogenase gamma subunit